VLKAIFKKVFHAIFVYMEKSCLSIAQHRSLLSNGFNKIEKKLEDKIDFLTMIWV
jgi:hypothetical protein